MAGTDAWPDAPGSAMDPRRGADGRALRRHNMALLLQMLASGTARSRAELVAGTGLTKATVSALAAELVDGGLVAETAARATDRPGRPATVLAPDPLGPVGVGLQVQVDHVAGYAVDIAGRPLAREVRRADNAGRSAAHALRACRPVLRRLLDGATSAGRYVAGIALAAPARFTGGSDGASRVLRSAELGWGETDLARLLHAEAAALGVHGIEIAAGRDTAFAAGAEVRDGDPGFLYLGGESGLGAVAHPATGDTGDFGHLRVRPRGPACPCGSRGCLDRYAGPAALLGDNAPVRRLTGTSAPAADPAADPAAASAVAAALAEALRPVLALSAPEAVVLGGYLRALPPAELATRLDEPVPARTARLGPDAALRGAATAALSHIVDSPADWLAQLS